MLSMLQSLLLFVLAGLCEIGGGYLMWQWWRHGAALAVGAVGAALLVVYGVVPDRFDVRGGLLCLAGIAVMMYWPR